MKDWLAYLGLSLRATSWVAAGLFLWFRRVDLAIAAVLFLWVGGSMLSDWGAHVDLIDRSVRNQIMRRLSAKCEFARFAGVIVTLIALWNHDLPLLIAGFGLYVLGKIESWRKIGI